MSGGLKPWAFPEEIPVNCHRMGWIHRRYSCQVHHLPTGLKATGFGHTKYDAWNKATDRLAPRVIADPYVPGTWTREGKLIPCTFDSREKNGIRPYWT